MWWCCRRWRQDGALPGGARPPQAGAAGGAVPRCQGQTPHTYINTYTCSSATFAAIHTFNINIVIFFVRLSALIRVNVGGGVRTVFIRGEGRGAATSRPYVAGRDRRYLDAGMRSFLPLVFLLCTHTARPPYIYRRTRVHAAIRYCRREEDTSPFPPCIAPLG